MNPRALCKAAIAHSFSVAATAYDEHSLIQKEIGARLLKRLMIMKNSPQRILDVGSGTGYHTRLLQQQYPHSQIIGLDLAQGMISYAKQLQSKKFWQRHPTYICADTAQLPFTTNSFDLIFSNFTLQWCYPLTPVFSEFKRVLKPGGMIFFSTVGPHTLHELRKSFASVDPYAHVNSFLDMHDIGDCMLQAQFTDPVVDMEMLKVTYVNVKQLLQDLKATGARNIHPDAPKGLMPKRRFMQMIRTYEQFKQGENAFPATFEVIYGHAYLPYNPLHRQEIDGSVRIPADSIPILQLT